MSVADFMKMPRQMEWDAEIAGGWPGPDGSSSSTDHIMGVRIGMTGTAYIFHTMPANLHDWRYHLGRSYALSARHRHAADVEYRNGCIRAVAECLDGKTMIFIGTVRAWVRYYALRLFGGAAWKT
jgi:hypothetical protein